jgi:hypothetical protein
MIISTDGDRLSVFGMPHEKINAFGAGIHTTCGGLVSCHQTTATAKALFCDRCGLRVTIPATIENFAGLDTYFKEKFLPGAKIELPPGLQEQQENMAVTVRRGFSFLAPAVYEAPRVEVPTLDPNHVEGIHPAALSAPHKLPHPLPRCGSIPPTPGYAACTRTKGHDGPCAHDFLRLSIGGENESLDSHETGLG